jgi:hypothetical protein
VHDKSAPTGGRIILLQIITGDGRDNAIEQIDPGICMGDSTVMLSVAKHLSAHRDRPFAALRVTVLGPMYRPSQAVPISGLICEKS